MASAQEKRTLGPYAGHRTTPVLAENSSSAPRRQLVGQGGPFIDQTAPVFGQQLNAAGQNIIGNPDAQMLAMRRQDLQQQLGIDRIILGPAGIKRLPELRQRLRVDRIQVQKIDMHQRIDQCSTLLLDSNGDGATSEAIPQLLNPVLQGFRRLIQTEALPLFTVSFLQSNNMFLVGPIQADECSDFDIRFRYLHISPSFPRFKTIPAGSAHNPYSRVLEGHHLSIRSTSRTDRVRKSPLTVDSVGWLIRNATQPVFHKGLAKKRKTNQKTKQKTACGKCRSYGHPQTKQWPSAASA